MQSLQGWAALTVLPGSVVGILGFVWDTRLQHSVFFMHSSRWSHCHCSALIYIEYSTCLVGLHLMNKGIIQLPKAALIIVGQPTEPLHAMVFAISASRPLHASLK